MKSFSAEEIQALMENVIKEINKNPYDPKGKEGYCYQDDDGLIHMFDEKTGFYSVMSQEYFEALLKWKDRESDQIIKDYIVKEVKENISFKAKYAKPWYRKERW